MSLTGMMFWVTWIRSIIGNSWYLNRKKNLSIGNKFERMIKLKIVNHSKGSTDQSNPINTSCLSSTQYLLIFPHHSQGIQISQDSQHPYTIWPLAWPWSHCSSFYLLHSLSTRHLLGFKHAKQGFASGPFLQFLMLAYICREDWNRSS